MMMDVLSWIGELCLVFQKELDVTTAMVSVRDVIKKLPDYKEAELANAPATTYLGKL